MLTGNWNAVQTSHDDLAKKLTSASSASGLLQHRELFESLLELTFESSNDMGLNVQWDGYPLRWKLGNLHARQGTREPVTYPVAPADHSASCYWAVAKRMVSEVDYVALCTWVNSIDKLWTNDFQTIYISVHNRLLGDVHQQPDFWPFFSPWIKARCAHLGPYREHTTATHVPIGAIIGLNRVHFTWTGTFVLLKHLCTFFPVRISY